MKPYTEALLPTPSAIVNRRASVNPGARANALAEARIARRLREKITQLGLQVRRHKEQAYSLVNQSLASMTRPISPSMCPYADRSIRTTSIVFERLVHKPALRPPLDWRPWDVKRRVSVKLPIFTSTVHFRDGIVHRRTSLLFRLPACFRAPSS